MIKKRIFGLSIVLMSIISHSAQAELFVFYDKVTDLFGFKDADDNILIPPQFEHVMAPYEQKIFSADDKDNQFLVPVVKKGELWRMMPDGTLKFRTVFFDNGPDYYEEGLARFIKEDKVGFHDREGNVVIEPNYDFATPFQAGHAYVCNGCYAAYPNLPTYLPLSTSFYQHPREDMYKSVIGGKWGVIDARGNLITPLIYNSLEEIFGK